MTQQIATPQPFCVFTLNGSGLGAEPELLREVDGLGAAWGCIRADCAAADAQLPEECPCLEDYKTYSDYDTWRNDPARPTYAIFARSDTTRGSYLSLAVGDHFEYIVFAGSRAEHAVSD